MSRIQIIPAIDIIGGRCVRLLKGDYAEQTTYSGTPLQMAGQFAAAGVSRIHMVDLDGAKVGAPRNLDTLREVAAAVSVPIEWGGGIATTADLEAVFEAGASRAIIGSVAVLQQELFEQWLERFPGRIILGADIKDGFVAVRGWQQGSSVRAQELLKRFAAKGLGEAIVTDISRDGTLSGPSESLYTALQKEFPAMEFTVSGGISGMHDIRALDALGLSRVIAGKAIYEGRISMEEIRQWSQKG